MIKKLKAQNSKLKASIVFIFLILAVFYFFLVRPGLRIYAKAKELRAYVPKLKTAFKENDLDKVKKELSEFEKKYKEFENEAKSIFWARYIPLLGRYVNDFKNAVEAGDYFLKALDKTIVAIEPHADLLGFKKGESSFVNKPVEERLKTAVFTLQTIKKDVDEISKNMEQAEKRLEKIDPKRYPKNLFGRPIREKVIAYKEQAVGLAKLFVDAKDLIKNLPEILGADREKTYFVIFQNDKELRATGGFWTAYAVFKIDKGNIRMVKSGDIYDIDATIKNHPPAPFEILTYHKGVKKLYLRDINLSPDFYVSVKNFEKLYKKSPAYVDYDGVIAIDTKVLVDLLEIFGDTKVGDVVFSAKIDKRCDCPQAIYKLFDIIDRPTPYFRENRKGVLGSLTLALFYKAIGFSPSRYWGRLVNTMLKDLEEKHILLYFKDRALQRGVEKLGFAGRIKDYDGDYLHINDVNFAGAKSNMFVKHYIKSETKLEGDKVLRRLVIEYKNPYRHSDCNLERGGLCLNATLRNWLRVYVPKGSKLLKFIGSKKKVRVYEDLGKTVFEGFLTVTPKGVALVKIEYEIPKTKVIKDGKYRLLIQKQPGTLGHNFEVKLNKKKIFEGKLLKDIEIISKL